MTNFAFANFYDFNLCESVDVFLNMLLSVSDCDLRCHKLVFWALISRRALDQL